MIQTFLMGGFECTYADVGGGVRLDMLASTMHDVRCREDYQLLKAMGIRTVREGLSWSQIDDGSGTYNFDRFAAMMAIGKEEQIQQIWDLNHFDYPDYLDPFSDEFVAAFAKYAKQAIRIIRTYISGTIYMVPMNEISFFAWIAADMGKWAPFTKGRKNGFLFKRQLVKAAIAAMDAIRQVDPTVRFIMVDPFMRRLAKPPASKAALDHVTDFNESVRFEAWDMLFGLKYPELGGDPRYLDIIGVNYYLHNQEWVLSHPNGKRISHQMMDWESQDRVSFAVMLQSIYERYQRPMIISETGSFGENREKWLLRTFKEIDEALAKGLPVEGVCIYPVLDRLDRVGYLLPQSGIWDFDQTCDTCDRIPHTQSVDIISKYSKRYSSTGT